MNFGPFQVRADLGASCFGPVYLGSDPSTNTRVVIRTFELPREWRQFGEQSDLLDSFQKLCETTLDHPGLARPLAFGALDLAGTAMDAMRQARPVAEVLQRTQQLADAIDFAASAGVYHGMLSSCDVILEGERTGITGIGLAQALIKAGIPAEAGFPYGSPQRLAGAPPTRVDDVYSLAAITLELLIGTPKDPNEDTSRALREAQGLPERRRIPRPAPHETRLFTTIKGVDAGKLRAAFAAAFSEEPSGRPSTASDFVASFQDAVSNQRGTDERAPSVAAVRSVSDEARACGEDPPDGAALEPPSRQERVVAEGRATRRKRARARRRESLATSQPRESAPECPVARPVPSKVEGPEPIVDVALLADVTPPRAGTIDDASYVVPVQSGSRALLVAGVVAVSLASLATGFGGGFIVGQRSSPATESIAVSHDESVVEPQPTRAAVEDPKPIASSARAVAAANVAPQPTVPGVESGRLLVRSTPAGAGVVVDGQSRGVTPLALGELAFTAHTIEVSHPGHDTRRQRVTLSERRPARSVDFRLRPTSEPADSTAATNPTGSLQVVSRPSGAQVFVDDTLIGTTPFLLSNVAAGSRRVRIESPGYKVWMTSVEIEPSARVRVSASLEP